MNTPTPPPGKATPLTPEQMSAAGLPPLPMPWRPMTREERRGWQGSYHFPDGTPPQIASGSVAGQDGVWLWSHVEGEGKNTTAGLTFAVCDPSGVHVLWTANATGETAENAANRVKPSMTLEECRALGVEGEPPDVTI